MMGDNFDPNKLDSRALVGTVDWDSGGEQGVVKAVRLDPVTHALLTTSYPHHEIHAGEHHLAVKSILAADTEELDLLFKSPLTTGHVLDSSRRRKPHLVWIADPAAAATLWFIKESTRTFVPANVVSHMNRNFHAFAATESYYTSAMSICHTSGGSETSTEMLGPIYIGNDENKARDALGSAAGGRNEFILEPDSWYRLRLKSRVNSNSLTIWLDWYDHVEQTDLTG